MFLELLALFISYQAFLVYGSPLNQVHPYPRPQLSLARPQINDPKIVGGENTTIEAHPHQVSLLLWHLHICGGTLVSPRWVISAAHCTRLYRQNSSPLKFSIRLGSSVRNLGGSIAAVTRIIEHPLYDIIPYDYDISLIQLSRELQIDNTIKPIALPPLGQTNPRPGATATVTGWGTLHSGGPAAEVLQQVLVPIVSQGTCQTFYNNLPFWEPPQITERMICAGFAAGGHDACQGDSGGPMIVNNQLVGVISWGYGCAFPNAPGVYASVPSVRQWIKDVAHL